MREKGRIDRGWLGVTVQDGKGGAGIAAVDRTGPGARGGLRPGDLVTAVNGQPIDSARGLIRSVALTPPGNTVRLTIRRQARDLEVSVSVGRRPKIEED